MSDDDARHRRRARRPRTSSRASLRPRRLEDFVGQRHVVDQLALFVAAARERGEPTDHVLLAGPPGLGKTSLAHVVAVEMGSRIHTISGPALERKGDLAAILTALEPRDVLFVDEIHRLPRAIEEILYPAMEDGAIDIVIGQGPGARTLRLDLAPFTLVGATTRAGLLTTPLRDRFGISFRLEHYGQDDLVKIVLRSARILGVEVDEDAAAEIARRARGTPRVANRILRRVRDVAQVRAAAPSSTATRPSRRSTSWASTPTASTAPTASTCACWPCASAAARSASPRWPSRPARTRARWRRSTSPT